MKKKLLFTCLIGLISVTSAYAACDGGTEVTNTAGTTFCKSNVPMNWWSAAAWCKANRMQLASMYEMCPSWDGREGVECPELTGKANGYAWSATANGDSYAWGIQFGSIAKVYGDYAMNRREYSRYDGFSAFCK